MRASSCAEPASRSPLARTRRAGCAWNVIDTLSRCRVDARPRASGLGNLQARFAARQIRLVDRYRKARTWNVKHLERIAAGSQNTPEDTATCVIHNPLRQRGARSERSDAGRRRAFDWEMATLGDPLMDLGNALAYRVQADDDFFIRCRQPTQSARDADPAAVVDYYAEKTGRRADNWAFYRVYGLFPPGP